MQTVYKRRGIYDKSLGTLFFSNRSSKEEFVLAAILLKIFIIILLEIQNNIILNIIVKKNNNTIDKFSAQNLVIPFSLNILDNRVFKFKEFIYRFFIKLGFY